MCTLLLCVCASLHAQVCTNALNPTPCNATLTQDGFTPSSELPCLIRGQAVDTVIQFKCWSQLNVYGTNLTVDSIKVDSLEYLPIGLCWSSNDLDNMYEPGEVACFRIQGITNDRAGQFKLKACFTVYSNGNTYPVYLYEHLGEKLILRLLNFSTSACYSVDTSQTEDFQSVPNPDNISTVLCRVYKDLDNNGLYTTGDHVFSNVTVKAGGQMAITNNEGICRLELRPGSYAIHPVLDSSATLILTSDTVHVNINDTLQFLYAAFQVSVSPNYCNHDLTLSPWASPPRPGFGNTMRIAYKNIASAAPLSDVVRVHYDSLQRVNYVYPTPSTIDSINRFIEWNVSNVSLGQLWYADMVFVSSTTLPLGSVVRYGASVLNNPCVGFSDYTHFETIAVGSYDPNDKAVSPIGNSDNHGINPSYVNKLTYHIRFQNTGTYLAEKVVIVDTISPSLDLNTLQVKGASHNYEVAIGDDRAVKFIFNNILLPDSNSDEPKSHGYVQFTIKLNPSLPQNTQLLNKADIYFDFNDPIRTNTAYNTVDYTVTSISEAKKEYTLAIYPNPTSGSVQVNVDERLLGEALILSDLSGRVLLSAKIEKPLMQLDMVSYASGVYLVRTGGVTKKLVKE